MGTKKQTTTPEPDPLNLGLASLSWYATAERKEWRDFTNPADCPAISLRAQGNRENIREWLQANGFDPTEADEFWTAWIIGQMFDVVRDMLIPALRLRRTRRGKDRVAAREQFEGAMMAAVKSTVLAGLFEKGGATKKLHRDLEAYLLRERVFAESNDHSKAKREVVAAFPELAITRTFTRAMSRGRKLAESSAKKARRSMTKTA